MYTFEQHVYTYIHVHTYVHTDMRTYIHTYIHIYTTYIHTYIPLHTDMYIHILHTFAYVYTLQLPFHVFCVFLGCGDGGRPTGFHGPAAGHVDARSGQVTHL